MKAKNQNDTEQFVRFTVTELHDGELEAVVGGSVWRGTVPTTDVKPQPPLPWKDLFEKYHIG